MAEKSEKEKELEKATPEKEIKTPDISTAENTAKRNKESLLGYMKAGIERGKEGI